MQAVPPKHSTINATPKEERLNMHALQIQVSLFLTIIAGALLPSSIAFASTPIRIHPENSRYFEYDGKATVLVTSAEFYGSVINLDMDYVAYLNALQANGLNYTRVFSGDFRPNNAWSGEPLCVPAGRFICPWASTSVTGGALGENKFDLSRYNAAYFTRLKDFLQEAADRGIIVEYVFFCRQYNTTWWTQSPLHPDNNINGLGSDCSAFTYLNVDNGGLFAHQKAFVEKVLVELQNCDNVFFEICNEPGLPTSTLPDGYVQEDLATEIIEWEQAIADAFKAKDATLPKQHLLAVCYFQITENVDICNYHYAATTAERIAAYLKGKTVPVFCDETGNRASISEVNDTVFRKQGWNFIVAGGAAYNNLDMSYIAGTDANGGVGEDGDPAINSIDGYFAGGPKLQAQLGYILSFMNSLDFIHMTRLDYIDSTHPANSFITSVDLKGVNSIRSLEKPGEEYAIYIDANSKTQVDLTINLPAGSYTLNWLNTKTGEYSTTPISGHSGGSILINSPSFADDIALRISADSDATPTH